MFFKQVVMGAVAVAMSTTMAFGAVDGVKFFVAKGDMEEAYNAMMEEKIEETGFILSDPHERINDAYREKYGSEKVDGKLNADFDPEFREMLDNLGFFSVANDEALRPLLLKTPQLAGFSPFNLHIYKSKDEDVTYVGHVMPETMLDIVGVEDKAVRDAFVASFDPLDALVAEEIGGDVKMLQYDKLPESPMMTFTYTFERPDEMWEFVDEFQEEFEEAFEEKKYIIAGYKNFKETYTDMEADFSRYDAFWVYSLCHFKFSYGIFNHGRPDAGVFAPCSMYMYVEKGDNVLHIGMPKLISWVAVMKIEDKKMVKSMETLDAEIIGIMEALGAELQ